MTHKTKTTADKIGNTTRPDRWRKYAAERLAIHTDDMSFIPAAWLEEIEGRPIADVITDYLCTSRGYGVTNPDERASWLYREDESFETESPRRRAAHEREVVLQAVMMMTCPFDNLIPKDKLHGFIRKFYHAGDFDLRAGIGRAIEESLNA